MLRESLSQEAKYLQRIAALEEEVRYLQDILRPHATLPASWNLTKAQTRLVVAIAQAQGCLTYVGVRQAVANIPDEVSDKTLEVHLFRARRKIRPFGVEIHTVRGIGLTMAPEGRAIVRQALAAVAAGGVA